MEPCRRALVLAALWAGGCASLRPPQEPLAAARERSVFVDGPAGRLRVSDGGEEGVPVLFVSGPGCSIACWRPQLDRLRPWRRAVSFDPRGQRESDPARAGGSPAQAAVGDLEAVVEALGLRRFYLVGEAGTEAALDAYAARNPSMVAGSLTRRMDPKRFEAALDALIGFAHAEHSDEPVRGAGLQTVGR